MVCDKIKKYTVQLKKTKLAAISQKKKYTLARYRFLTTVAPPRGGSAQLLVRVFKIPPVLICNIIH
jgi:hypothetical protein